MKILVACECSGVVRDAFAARGHDAWSCDIQPTETNGNHYQQDIFDQYGKWNLPTDFDLMIAHPPCTHLAVSGARWYDNKVIEQRKAVWFFMALVNAPVPKKCIENPVGVMSTHYKKPTQIVHPFMFGDSFQKTTCLWLHNLPPLFHADKVDLFNDRITHTDRGPIRVWSSGKKIASWFNETKKADKELTSKLRSRTFKGIANAMAEQWG